MKDLEAFGFVAHQLDEKHLIWVGDVPERLSLENDGFEAMWSLHPEEYHEIQIHGRRVKTPRWQQAYGMDYEYTGQVNQALPVPSLMEPFLTWCQQSIHERLNGVLLNWYDASLGHYIGKHRDSTKNMIEDTPIVTVSFGEERVFRLRPWKKNGFQDFPTPHGRVFIMPYETNRAWMHEVPAGKKYTERRISLTFRGFHL